MGLRHFQHSAEPFLHRGTGTSRSHYINAYFVQCLYGINEEMGMAIDSTEENLLHNELTLPAKKTLNSSSTVSLSIILVGSLLYGVKSCDRPSRQRFSRSSCVFKEMLRRFPRLEVANACFLCSPPYLHSSKLIPSP